MGFWRGLTLALLALAMGGFGICSLCGGVMGIQFLTEGRASTRDLAWFAFGCAAAGLVIVWLCWRAFKAVRRGRPAP